MFILQENPIDLSMCKKKQSHCEGAFVTFEGLVRADSLPQGIVCELLYVADGPAVFEEGKKIIQEAISSFALTQALCVQRIGTLKVGEIAVWIGVGAPHRDGAFKGCRYIIEEAKKRLMIWKKNSYTNGQSEWVHGPQTSVSNP